ncbi:hypothetical protein OGAPHI_001113 [Ogataea philodendri]|uniref:Uncharacterized protein n=1 Tax=Ogataea philodendri TaxID=1378263 RepID=A0A9P8PE49_9ASCO|nr:uncharacterized protein OGAPHI_001113 [Ogataea philodendri]KAH3670598.1 hypothetical protein OGAPHI_001113 [Ogataea philodendri]
MLRLSSLASILSVPSPRTRRPTNSCRSLSGSSAVYLPYSLTGDPVPAVSVTWSPCKTGNATSTELPEYNGFLYWYSKSVAPGSTTSVSLRSGSILRRDSTRFRPTTNLSPLDSIMVYSMFSLTEMALLEASVHGVEVQINNDTSCPTTGNLTYAAVDRCCGLYSSSPSARAVAFSHPQ